MHLTFTFGFSDSVTLARRRRFSLYWFWFRGMFSCAIALGPLYLELNNNAVLTREEHRTLMRERGISAPVLRRWLRRNGR